eukprot:2555037-Amphidinium_carterae.2
MEHLLKDASDLILRWPFSIRAAIEEGIQPSSSSATHLSWFQSQETASGLAGAYSITKLVVCPLLTTSKTSRKPKYLGACSTTCVRSDARAP